MDNQIVLKLMSKIDTGHTPTQEEIKELATIESIDLSGIELIPVSIRLLSGLKEMNITGDSFERIDLNVLFTGKDNLQNLTIKSSKINELPENIGALFNLRKLKIQGTEVSDISVLSRLTNLNSLDLSLNRNLSDISALSGLTSLINLNLRGTSVSDISPLSRLTSLINLDLQGTSVSDISPLSRLTSLTNLNLNKTQINELPIAIGDLANLQYLNLGHTKISELPETIGNLTSIQSLILNNTQICDLPESVGNCVNLQNLNLDYTQITELPDTIGNLINVQSLILNNTQLLNLPESVGNLINLQNLDLSQTLILTLPEAIGKTINLHYLNLKNTSIQELPNSIGNLKYLLSLDLWNTNIHYLPDTIGNLKNLESLTLSSNNITELTNAICDLKNLQNFDLGICRITTLPKAIVKLTNLRRLTLWHTQITELPADIGKLKNLQTLYLRSTPIHKLPISIGRLSNLERLDLRNTLISDLPASIGNLTCLQQIDLRNCLIKELPKTLGKLTSLKELVLEDLVLDELPESLLSLNLEYKTEEHEYWNSIPGIYIKGLQLINQPVELFSQSRETIAEYYKLCKKRIPINECKVVFLGDGGAGKSLIINRLLHDGFIVDFLDEVTPGICISSKIYKIGDEEIELHFWDFGGQAIMHSLHRLFITKRSLYVIVVNARDTRVNEQAEYWIRNVKSFANGTPVILLINQNDVNPYASINENGLRKEYPALKCVKIISAMKDTQRDFITEVQNEVLKAVYDMETVHTPFSASWLSLMNNLQEMPDDYISSNDFYKMCYANRINTDRDVLDQIVNWYQDLGVCFRSQTYPDSTHYMILKPSWLLNGLYTLIFNGRKYAANGIIPEAAIEKLLCEKESDDTIKKVWGDIAYNTKDTQYIINVLLSYELMYRLDNEHFFLPMLCDEKEPENFDTSDLDKAFHVYFKYDYLPENVLHRLMVRYGKELDLKCVWRTGASFVRSIFGWRITVCINNNCLDVYSITTNQKVYPVKTYFEMFRESIYDINSELGLSADEYWAYTHDGKEDYFEYETLIASRKNGINEIYSRVFDRVLSVNEILNDQNDSNDQLIENILEIMLSALANMSKRSMYLVVRNEAEITAYLKDTMEPDLYAKYGIQLVSEYDKRHKIIKLGETDLCFIQYKNGFKEELLFGNCKEIYAFRNQYIQLMSYLNPDCIAGVTLSINRKLKREEAYDYIYNELMKLKSVNDAFAPISINRRKEGKITMYIITEHIVPETGLTIQVFHLAMHLSDKHRAKNSKKSRI